LWENARYGSVYVVDRPALDESLLGDAAPVLHLGQPQAIDVVTAAYAPGTWLVVELWADLLETEARLHQRDEADPQERLAVWADTASLTRADLRIDTAQQTPSEIAVRIRQRFLQCA
jgi:guanylate kinase